MILWRSKRHIARLYGYEALLLGRNARAYVPNNTYTLLEVVPSFVQTKVIGRGFLFLSSATLRVFLMLIGGSLPRLLDLWATEYLQ